MTVQSTTQPPERHQGAPARWAPDFLVLSVLWGSSFALIKVAVEAGVAPVWVALARCLFGAVALIALIAVRRIPLPTAPRTWAQATVVALLLNVLPTTFLAYGESQVSSVLAGILNATVPLATVLFVPLLVPRERITRRQTTGLLLGFVGVLAVLGIWNGLGSATLLGSLACLASPLLLGTGFAYTRRTFSEGDASAMSAVQLICATVVLLVAAPPVSGAPAWPGWGAVIALVALGVLGTGIAFLLNLRIIRTAGPTVASTVTYVIPIWSTLFGTLALSEPLTWNAALGAVLVLGGVLLSRPRRPQESPGTASTDSQPAGQIHRLEKHD